MVRWWADTRRGMRQAGQDGGRHRKCPLYATDLLGMMTFYGITVDGSTIRYLAGGCWLHFLAIGLCPLRDNGNKARDSLDGDWPRTRTHAHTHYIHTHIPSPYTHITQTHSPTPHTHTHTHTHTEGAAYCHLANMGWLKTNTAA